MHKLKKPANDTSDSWRYAIMCNHLNIPEIINEIDKSGPSRFTQEGNEHG